MQSFSRGNLRQQRSKASQKLRQRPWLPAPRPKLQATSGGFPWKWGTPIAGGRFFMENPMKIRMMTRIPYENGKIPCILVVIDEYWWSNGDVIGSGSGIQIVTEEYLPYIFEPPHGRDGHRLAMGPFQIAIPPWKVVAWLCAYLIFFWAIPPKFAMFVQTRGKRLDSSNFVDVLSMNLEFPRLLI